jgi:hypothetical protein
MRVIENERKSVLFAYQKKASRFPYNFHNFTRCDVVSTWSGLVNDILQGGDSPISKWRIHLLKGLVQTAVSAHLQRFGE